MASAYDTIANQVDTEIEIQRSRFLTRLVRVDSEGAARDEIAQIKNEHPKARHHCTAFVIGAAGGGSDSRIMRTNDDGEPAGTAGAPMLEALTQAGLSDVVAIVTRYFGGILLGAGGLTRAYRSAVAGATAEAKRVTRDLRHEVFLDLSYEVAPLVEAWARRNDITVLGAEYGANVRLALAVAGDKIDTVSHTASELSAGQAVINVAESRYVDI